VLSFQRQAGHERLVVVANLSDQAVTATLKSTFSGTLQGLLGTAAPTFNTAMQPTIALKPWQVAVFQPSR
jgi:hypothetical protein